MCAVWEAGVEITTSDGAAAAAASGGGTPLSSTSSVPVGATATTSDAAYIQVNGGDKLTMGQLGIPPLMSDSGSFSRDLRTKVGDTVSVSTAVAVASAAPVGGDATASASGRITLRFGRCAPPTPIPPTSTTAVPTLSEWAIVVTGIMLATAGYFGTRRRSRDQNRR